MGAKLTTLTKDVHRARLTSVAVFSALAVILFSTSVPAQQPTFRSGVELVQVDVVVVDRDGKHIRGLKAADFAVLDRDKPQTIATFEEMSHEGPREAATVPLLTRPARLDVGNNQSSRRGQPHFVLGPKSPCHGGRPCGAKRGAPSAATR